MTVFLECKIWHKQNAVCQIIACRIRVRASDFSLYFQLTFISALNGGSFIPSSENDGGGVGFTETCNNAPSRGNRPVGLSN